MYRNTHATVGQNPGHSVVRCPLSVVSGQRQLKPRTTDYGLRTFRFGISLTEVLIAMGILTVGLLGVAAIFPVGSYYMQKGDVADRGSAIAQAAFNEAISRGVLNPANWLSWEDNITGVPLPPGSVNGTFLRPFASLLSQYKASQAGSTALERDKQKSTSTEFGSVYVIDPLGIASIALTEPVTNRHIPDASVVYMRVGSVFPSSNAWTAGIPTNKPLTSMWYPWSDASSLGPRWPIRRISLRQPISATPLYRPLDPTLSGKLFSSPDDLALELPTAQDKPSIQRMDVANVDLNGDGNSTNDRLARQSRGDYSWILTVSPTTAEARDALATDPSAFSYEVSVAVFYKRPLAIVSPKDRADIIANLEYLNKNERGFNARIVSTGLNGGELLLSSTATDRPFDTLKVGNWIMLCGPNPNGTNERPMMTARWYRVLAIEGRDRRLNSEGDYDPPPAAEPERRLVSLRGPQWPWQPAANLTYDDQLSNALYVCVPTGAVAVHSKTIHLEGNSAWSGGAEGISIPPPPGPRWRP